MINGISCVTFTSASSLFIVISEGVEMMLLLPSLRNACISAAKPRPVFELYFPSAKVAPVPTVELLIPVPVVPVVGIVVVVPPVTPKTAAAKLTMLVPLPGRLVTP